MGVWVRCFKCRWTGLSVRPEGPNRDERPKRLNALEGGWLGRFFGKGLPVRGDRGQCEGLGNRVTSHFSKRNSFFSYLKG